MTDVTIVCQGCAKPFSVPFRKNRMDKIKFCSIKCFARTKQKTVECVQCKKSMTLPQSSEKKFCSSACYNATRKPLAQDYYSATCEECSKEFPITSTRKYSARFCSRDCQSKSAAFRAECAERMTGENNWRWQGGKYKGGSVYQRQGAESKPVHRELFCNHMLLLVPDHPFIIEENGIRKLARAVHVHHIDRNPSNNELSNLLAVTIDAHAKIHHSGRKPSPWECWPPNPERW